MATEVNENGEVYEWTYSPPSLSTWDEATKAWDAPGNNQPWDYYGVQGKWTVSTTRELHIGESTNSHLFRHTQEYLAFLDAKLKNDGVVFNDFEISTEALSFDEFKNLAAAGTPIGYEPLRPLYPGEYTYQKAIIGLRMRAYNLGTTLGFYKAILNVDVEDIICRGTVTVTSTDPSLPTKVYFQKWYYNPPEELMFTIMDFTEPCAVEVLTKTSEYFTFMLKSTINEGRYVTGTVSWLSNGY